ncbi:O-antigen ligase family protein [Bacteroides gallinaceum]|uniref:O-antigen ligase family protein n=1 Tax=Bacteroides gallinaceum TaxID=1462571 RepID=UPI001957F77D|nr:O-antigen ligase family protein [Bacteroides gallinaceum]MBM6720999.1 O-antigen ligase family protein [Bacteroides gallinaceum]
MKSYIVSLEIIFLSLLIPWGINSQKAIVALITVLLLIYNTFKIRNGYTLLLLTMALCIPNTSNASDESISKVFSLLFHVIRIGILFTLIFQCFVLKIKNNIIPRSLKYVIIAFIFLNFFYAVAFNDFSLFLNGCFYYPITTYAFLYITYNDNINLEKSSKLFDFIFAIFSFYVILEFVFNISPYDFLYNNFLDVLNIESIGRAKGLLGHPLMVSCVVLLYEVFLLYRLVKKEKVIIQIILCIIIGILTVSRTTYLFGLIEIFFWIILNKKYKSSTFYLLFISFLIISLWIITNMMNEYINDVIYRFQNDNIDQRLGAFDIVSKLLSKHPLGCGSDFFSTIRKEGISNALFTNTFETLDNYFLTQLSIYGYLGILVFVYDYFFAIRICIHGKIFKQISPHIILLFIVRFVMSFSFDVHAYMIFNMIFYYILAFVIKSEKLNFKTKNKSIITKHGCFYYNR